MSNSFRKAIVSWTTHRSPSNSILKEKKPDQYLEVLHKKVEEINLKNVEKVSVSFDPFHSQINSIRDILTYITSKNVYLTNMECLVKTNILSDRSEPILDLTLTLMEEYSNVISKLRDELNQRWCKNRLLLMQCEEKSQELLLLKSKLESIRQQESLLKNDIMQSLVQTMDSSLFSSNHRLLTNVQRNAAELDRTIAFLQKQLQQKEKIFRETHSSYESLYNDYKLKIDNLLINKNFSQNYLQHFSEVSDIKKLTQDNLHLTTTLKSLNDQHKELESLEKQRKQLEDLLNNESSQVLFNTEENNLLPQDKDTENKNSMAVVEVKNLNLEKYEINLDCQPDIIDISSPEESCTNKDINFEKSERKIAEIAKSDLNRELVDTPISLRNYSLNQNELIHVNEPPAKKSKIDVTSRTYSKEFIDAYCYSLLKNESQQSKVELTNSATESFFGLKENQSMEKFNFFSQGNDEDINSPFTFKF